MANYKMLKKNRKRVYIIAEAGINFNASLKNCFRLIDAVADAGCDCIKFQLFKAEFLYPRSAGKLDWKDAKRSYSYDIYSAVRSFELPRKWVKRLMDYCWIKGIDFLSSVFDEQGLVYLMRLGSTAIKIPSLAVTNIPLVERCARYKIPLIMSTGGSTLGEVEEAVRTINKYHNHLSLLHCSLKYPTPLKECNLGVIQTLRHAFPANRIGFSDHAKETSTAAVEAVYLGAEIIEKHITLDKKMEGPDHFFALEPGELKKMVKDIRRAEKDCRKGDFKINKTIYGNTEKKTYPHERYIREFGFTRLFIKRHIRKGQVIRPADIAVLRPGKKKQGLEPKYLRLFIDFKITVKRDCLAEEALTWELILS